MFGLLMSDEQWLNGTNALLGLVCVIALIAIAGAVSRDILEKIRKRASARQHLVFDHHSVHIPELGLTMADGGEPVDDNPDLPDAKK